MNPILDRKLDRIVMNINKRARKYGLLNITKTDLVKKIEENGMACCYCGRQLRIYDDHRAYKDAVSIDHKLAMALGGANDLSNIAICCHECNDRKNWVEAPLAQVNGKKGATSDPFFDFGNEVEGGDRVLKTEATRGLTG